MRLARLLRRSSRAPATPEPAVTVDAALARWVDASLRLADDLGPGGRLVLAVLGESLVDGRPSCWFGYEPTRDGLAALLAALGEDPGAADALCELELGMAGRRLGAVPEGARERWTAFVAGAVRDPAATSLLPARDRAHLDAEEVWRRAAASVQPWRTVQLDPDGALGQVRWYPGCPTRTSIGYSDPLGLSSVQRAVREHRCSREEHQALLPASALEDLEVDPLTWRLSSLSFAVSRQGTR